MLCAAVFTLLTATIFDVFPLYVPRGFTSVVIAAFDQDRGAVAFSPPTTASMDGDGDTVILISRLRSDSENGKGRAFSRSWPIQRIAVYHAHTFIGIVTPPSGRVFASQPFGAAAPLDGKGQPVFSDLRTVGIVISNGRDVYVTERHDFDGAYSGTELWSFRYRGERWIPVSALSPISRLRNVIVSAAYDARIGYAANSEAAPDYVGSDARSGLTDRDEAWIQAGSSVIRIGDGTISGISQSAYIGYDSHFSPEPPHFSVPPNAFEWTDGHRSSLGTGIPWALNRDGLIVGDDRSIASSPGEPIVWNRGSRVTLSPAAGSAFGINDRGQVVGDLLAKGGFIATMNGRSASLAMLDTSLAPRARAWHIEHAYAIAADGSILAVGRLKNEAEAMVVLVPRRVDGR